MIGTDFAPKYELGGFIYEDSKDFFQYGYTEEELLGIAYFASIRRRVVVNNKTWLCAVDGSHRSGKTLGVCAAASLIDPTFQKNFYNRFIYDPQQLFSEIENLRKNDIRGGVIAVDEAGASLSAMDWYEDWSKAISEMFQVIGYLNPIVFFIAPVRDFVNSPIRKMQHAYWKFSRPSNEYTILKPYELSYSSTYKKTFNLRPNVTFNGIQKAIDRIKMPLPPRQIIDQYEEFEKPRKDELLRGFGDRIKQSKAKEVKIKKDPRAIVDYIQENYDTNTAFKGKRSLPDEIQLDLNYIRYKFDLPLQIAQGVKKDAEREINKKFKGANQNV